MESENSMILTNSLTIARSICKKKIKPGCVVVDATMGNGNDTVFLAGLVGSKGLVYAFDVQDIALERTQKKLSECTDIGQVRLIKDGHENIDLYIDEEIDIVIFNLGYLPRADHSITTKANTTLEALGKSLGLLKNCGIALLVVYYGHEQGKAEKKGLDEFIKGLDQKEFSVAKLSFANQKNCPPELIMIEKIQ